MTIMIGYDGSDGAVRALEWAVTEARARHAALTVCHVWQAPFSDLRVLTWTGPIRDAAKTATAQALTRIHELAPELKADGMTPGGSPAGTLLEKSADVELLVVGYRGEGGSLGLGPGSVSTHVAAHSQVPVVVVRGETEPPPEFEPGRIVVGFDGSPTGRAALAFALREAWLRGLPLTAVCAWPPGPLVRHAPPFMDDAALRACAHDRFLADLSAAQADYPDVEVRTKFTDGQPAPELLADSASARLLVVGAHNDHPMRTWFHDSVVRSALHEAPCPVAVVHAER